MICVALRAGVGQKACGCCSDGLANCENTYCFCFPTLSAVSLSKYAKLVPLMPSPCVLGSGRPASSARVGYLREMMNS